MFDDNQILLHAVKATGWIWSSGLKLSSLNKVWTLPGELCNYFITYPNAIIQASSSPLMFHGWMTKTWYLIKLINSSAGNVRASCRMSLRPGVWIFAAWVKLKQKQKKNKKTSVTEVEGGEKDN